MISVILPVYKVEEYLDRCIESILCQSYKNFELIIVDDESPDRCPAMCDEWAKKDSRIIVIHQTNQGVSAARNTGIRRAKGEYFTFIDSDDWITDTMLEDLLELIKKYDADISICNFVRTYGEKSLDYNDDIKEAVYLQKEFMKIILKIGSNRIIHYPWGKLYSRKVIDKKNHYPVGMLNEDVEGMFKAVIASSKIAETTKVGYYYFENQDSISRRKFGENFLCLHKVWRRILKISEKYAPEYYDYVKYNLIRIDFTVLVDMILYGDKETDRLYKANEKKIRNRLRKNLMEILRGPMVIKRKIAVVLICFFYTPIKSIIRIIKRVKKG